MHLSTHFSIVSIVRLFSSYLPFYCRDDIIIMRKDMELNQWSVVESNMKITKTTVSFDTKNLGR